MILETEQGGRPRGSHRAGVIRQRRERVITSAHLTSARLLRQVEPRLARHYSDRVTPGAQRPDVPSRNPWSGLFPSVVSPAGGATSGNAVFGSSAPLEDQETFDLVPWSSGAAASQSTTSARRCRAGIGGSRLSTARRHRRMSAGGREVRGLSGEQEQPAGAPEIEAAALTVTVDV